MISVLAGLTCSATKSQVATASMIARTTVATKRRIASLGYAWTPCRCGLELKSSRKQASQPAR